MFRSGALATDASHLTALKMGGKFIRGVDSQPRNREFRKLLIEKAWCARQAQCRKLILAGQQ